MAMIEFVNALTHTRMYVAPEREAEYLAAGHTRVTDKPDAQPGGAAPAEQTAAAPPKAQAPAAKPASKTPRPAAKKKPAAKRSTPAKK